MHASFNLSLKVKSAIIWFIPSTIVRMHLGQHLFLSPGNSGEITDSLMMPSPVP
jgi:hypothetical protein